MVLRVLLTKWESLEYYNLVKFVEFFDMLSAVDGVFCIGKSVQDKDILACHRGKKNGKQMLVQASIHAREFVTSILALLQANYLAKQNIDFGVYFVLCSNPDGVQVAMDGYDSLSTENKQICIAQNVSCGLFKANANLVDLNTNFDALWGTGKQNIRQKSYQNYIGTHPNSEPETKALIAFANEIRPDVTLSYHTKGQVIFYGFDTQNKTVLAKDKKLGEIISKSLGFALKRSFGSAGGFKDFMCMQNVPSFTIEFGAENLAHPISINYVKTFFMQSENLFFDIDKYFFKTENF